MPISNKFLLLNCFLLLLLFLKPLTVPWLAINYHISLSKYRPSLAVNYSPTDAAQVIPSVDTKFLTVSDLRYRDGFLFVAPWWPWIHLFLRTYLLEVTNFRSLGVFSGKWDATWHNRGDVAVKNVLRAVVGPQLRDEGPREVCSAEMAASEVAPRVCFSWIEPWWNLWLTGLWWLKIDG